jgi:hydroxymethylpyrimidine pyrophosphatase-like HAD family hydrolase
MEMIAKNGSRLFVFTDLDDTLFQSIKKAGCITATVNAQGVPYAYSSIQQQKLLQIMANSGGLFIPVTGRRTGSFLNSQLPVIMNCPFAIVSHGAVILDNNHELLDEWLTFLKQQFNLVHWEEKLTTLCNALSADFAEIYNGIRVRLIVDQGITAYICIKIPKENYKKNTSIDVNRLLMSKLGKDMLLHGNGRNFAILPPYAQKKIAVDFIKEKMMISQNDTVFGIGDSHSDLPFMKDTDFLIVPSNAQILNEAK